MYSFLPTLQYHEYADVSGLLLQGQPGSRQRPHPSGEEASDESWPKVTAGDQEPLRRRRGHLPSGFHQIIAHVLISRQGQTQAEKSCCQARKRGGNGSGGKEGGGEEREGGQIDEDPTNY